MKGKKDIVSVKDLIPETLAKCMGNVSQMCKQLNISRTHFYRLYNEDSDFAASCTDVKEMILDTVEGKLFKAIKGGNVTAMIFYLKTQGRSPGYIENPSMNINMADNITEVVINVKGRDE